MFDFITRMFVVVNVEHILRVFHVAIRRLNKLIELRAASNEQLEILANVAADTITSNISQIKQAENVIRQLEHIVSGKSYIN